MGSLSPVMQGSPSNKRVILTELCWATEQYSRVVRAQVPGPTELGSNLSSSITSFHESQVGFVQLQPELQPFINIGVSHYQCIRQLWNWILFPRDASTTRNTHSLSSPPHQMTISVRQCVGTAPATTHVLDTPSLSSTSTIGKNSDFWSASKSHFHRPDLEV